MTASVRIYFSFSTGLAQPITCPKGTLAQMQAHVRQVAAALGLKVTKYKDNPAHWTGTDFKGVVDDDTLCREVETHNRFVRWFYDALAEWAEKPPTGEVEIMTPADAATFWHGIEILEVPPARWSREHYVSQMEDAYEVLRGRGSDGRDIGCKPLSVAQAAAVIWLMAPWLDKHDMRLAVPRGHDRLASSYDGGYDWCEYCGPIDSSESEDRARHCRRGKKCPLREILPEDP